MAIPLSDKQEVPTLFAFLLTCLVRELRAKKKLFEMNTGNFERMDMIDLEQYTLNHPYENRYKNRNAWYVYGCRLLDGRGCPKDPEKALDHFEEISCKDSRAALQAGFCYYNGVGTSQDMEEALKYFRRVSDVLGIISREGYLWMGKCLLKIQKGQEAIACLKKVMENVKVLNKIVHAKPEIEKEAKCLLGMCHYYGIEVKENKEIALQYFKEASLGERANLIAQYYLSHCYQKGIGTKVNPKRAEHWRSICFEQDYKGLVNEMKNMVGVTSEKA